jgi:arsenate reductase
MLKLYEYPSCSTCRKAKKWLNENGIPYQSVHIADTPPTAAELSQAIHVSGMNFKKFFNTSGASYRDGNFKTKLESMTEGQAVTALSNDGKLIKRPLAIDGDRVLLGYNAADWAKALDQEPRTT